jgi:hypothetical protein
VILRREYAEGLKGPTDQLCIACWRNRCNNEVVIASMFSRSDASYISHSESGTCRLQTLQATVYVELTEVLKVKEGVREGLLFEVVNVSQPQPSERIISFRFDVFSSSSQKSMPLRWHVQCRQVLGGNLWLLKTFSCISGSKLKRISTAGAEHLKLGYF